MANLRLVTTLRTSLAQDILDALDAGSGPATLEVYDGTQPANANVAVSTQTLLGVLTCSNPAGSVASGTLTFGAITDDSSANASGTATWVRMKDSDGNTVGDGDAGTSSATFIFNSVTIVAGGVISCTAGAISVPAA